MRKTVCTLLLCFCVLCSCEKPFVDDVLNDQTSKVETFDVKFNIKGVDLIPFDDANHKTRASVPAQDVCSRIGVAIFKNGSKVCVLNREKSKGSFTDFQMQLPKGSYQIVAVAHSGLKNATISSPEKITFDGKVTDTFYYYGTFDVNGEDVHDIYLERAVSKFKLSLEDNIPSAVKSLKFFYTGGSSTFNAVTGYGCVKSRQTEVREIHPTAYSNASFYEVYTFPHDNEGELNVHVSALSEMGDVLFERSFERVNIQRNMVSIYQGVFFQEMQEHQKAGIAFWIDSQWHEQSFNF